MTLIPGQVYIHNPFTGETVPYEDPPVTLEEVQSRLKQAEHSIRVLEAALAAERERGRDTMRVWDWYAAAAIGSMAQRRDWLQDTMVLWAAEMADAMLAERAKRAAP